MNILIDGSKIVSVGFVAYNPTGSQELKEIDDIDWQGKRISEIYWDGSQVANKTAEMMAIETEKANALRDLEEEDKKLPRGTEDFIDDVIRKGLMIEDDLGVQLRTRWNKKKALREKI